MNREGQDTLLLFVGVMVLQVGITDLHLRYVKPQMQPLLLAAGAVLTVLAVVSIVRSQRAGREPVTASPSEHVAPASDGDGPDHGSGHGHSHGHLPRTAWLLALPLLVLTLVTPPSLGAYAAARGSTTTVQAPSGALPGLPPAVDGAVGLTLTDFATRAVYAPDSLAGSRVRLTGFVLPEEDGWTLARIALSCCAADGRPVRVRAGGAPAPAADSWVQLEGRFDGVEGEGSERVPVLAVERVQPVEPPVQQYE
jgi:uncharacterized repeat protein (TIGR03943 family)